MKTSDDQVIVIATAIFKATSEVQEGRQTYLRTLLAETQDALGNKRGQEANVQLTALKAVHERFYEIVIGAADEFVPKGTRDRGTVLHNKANFARTALSALRGHVRAGGDLVYLSPEKVTKGSLRSRAGPTRAVSARRWKVRAERQSKSLVATFMGLADADKGAAIEEMQLVLGQITQQLISLGVVATTDMDKAVAEHRPYRSGKMLFVPTDTQILRQQAKPS